MPVRAYDDRMLSWQIPERRVSIWTVSGRVKDVAFTASQLRAVGPEDNRLPGGLPVAL
jgi:hypothetical protein